MVTTHKKYPTDVRHNAYYAADGSDLRDATSDEIEKYRLAAAHKRRRPEAKQTHDIGESASTTLREDGKEIDRQAQRDVAKHRNNSPRIRSKETGSRSRGTEEKSGRLSSRDSRKGRDNNKSSRNRGEVGRRESVKESGGHHFNRAETGGGDMGEVDKDERDRREMEEIRPRIEGRKLSKEASFRLVVRTSE